MAVVRTGILIAALTVIVGLPARAEAQGSRWVADVTAGDTGFVDEETDHFFTIGGAVRRFVTPRISIGPEFVAMTGQAGARDLAMMVTGNVVFDVYSLQVRDGRRVTPFLVGGVGMFWSRERFATGPFWSSDPAFTAGGGIRGRIGERVSAAAEYRIGWELHQRVTGTLSFDLW